MLFEAANNSLLCKESRMAMGWVFASVRSDCTLIGRVWVVYSWIWDGFGFQILVISSGWVRIRVLYIGYPLPKSVYINTY